MKTIYLSILLVLLSIVHFACSKKSNECTKVTWYQDADGDGLGNPAVSYSACDAPLGYVSNANDTDDKPQTPSSIPTKGYSTPTTYPNMTSLWADEFDGTSLNEKYWNYELGDGCPNNCGWGNEELEYYKKENTIVKDGYLTIQAKAESFGGKNYTSSRLTTQNKLNVKYGRIDIRAALPQGQGLWPAIWMLGKNISTVNWPKCGEIDIMEMIGGGGRENKIYGTAHWDNGGSAADYGGNYSLTAGYFYEQFHVYSIIWDAKKIIWYVDDIKFHEIDITPAGLSAFKEEFFFILNVATGGKWPGTPDKTTTFPQSMIIDYIRVFQ